jgi:hypothetical protein
MTASWQQFAAEARDFADFVRQRIDDHGLALLATLSADGSVVRRSGSGLLGTATPS